MISSCLVRCQKEKKRKKDFLCTTIDIHNADLASASQPLQDNHIATSARPVHGARAAANARQSPIPHFTTACILAPGGWGWTPHKPDWGGQEYGLGVGLYF